MDATDLCFAGAAEQARLVAAGEISARELVDATIARIEALQPRVNAFSVVLADRARIEADQADARRRAGGERSLLGVPVAIKDDVDVAGQFTAWGTAAHGPAKQHDAEVVRRLRSAGAIIVGKTLTPELMMLPATDTTTFGAARNPWDVSRTPGGSSGGTGAAVAAGLCGVALGSDGAGSIRGPAAWCGLVGLKPRRDLVPLAPHDGAWQGLSVSGPLARRTADAALFMDAAVPGHDFAGAVTRGPGRLRVAVSVKAPPGAQFKLGREERGAVDALAADLRALGHEVVERDPDYPRSLWGAVYARLLRGIHDDVATLPHADRLEARTRHAAALGGLLSGGLMRRVRAAEADQARRIGELFRDVDVLVTPSCAEGPYRAGEMGRRSIVGWAATASRRIPYFVAFNVTGQPAMNVPAGHDDDGLPMGVQMVGRPDGDATLLALAGQLEARRGWSAARPVL
ncbi:MAG: amidase [Solirubrobacteraceae bacterium]